MNAPTTTPTLDFGSVALSAEYAPILIHLRDHGPVATIAKLAEGIGHADASNLRKVIVRLESAGLISRGPDLAVTDAARRALVGVAMAGGEIELDPNARLIPFNRLRLNPDNPRKDIPAEVIEERLASILATRPPAVTVPLIVAEEDATGDHLVFDGEVRWRAVKLGIERGQLAPDFPMPARLRDYDATKADGETALVALIANCQRSDLTELERARAIATVKTRFMLKNGAEVAAETGVHIKVVQEALQVLDRATPEQLKTVEDGLVAWTVLRDNLKALKLDAADALVLGELAVKANDDPWWGDGADLGNKLPDGPPWAHLDGRSGADLITGWVPGGVALVRRGLIEFAMAGDGDLFARAVTTKPQVEAWLNDNGFEHDRGTMLYNLRCAAIGSFDAKAMEGTGRYVTTWLNPMPTVETPAPEDDEQDEQDEPQTVSPAAERATAMQRMILVEIAHKRANNPLMVPQGESPPVACAAMAMSPLANPETKAMCWAGWISANFEHVSNQMAVQLSEFGERQIAGDARLASLEINALLQAARKEAGLSQAARFELQSTGRYAFAPLNATTAAREAKEGDQPAPRPVPGGEDQSALYVPPALELEPKAHLALAELACKAASDPVSSSGKGIVGAAVYNYWDSPSAQVLLDKKMIGFAQYPGGWLAYIHMTGKAWLADRGHDPAVPGCTLDLDILRAAAGVTDLPEEGGWTSGFLNPQAAKVEQVARAPLAHEPAGAGAGVAQAGAEIEALGDQALKELAADRLAFSRAAIMAIEQLQAFGKVIRGEQFPPLTTQAPDLAIAGLTIAIAKITGAEA